MMAHLVIFIYTLSLILCSLNQAAGKVYNIKPTSANLCNVPRLILSQFITYTETSHSAHSNITMVFHSGIHYLNVSFSPTDLHSLTMYSNSTAAQIVCVGHSHITFRRFQMIRIVDLEFIGCARNRIEEIGSFELVNTIFKHGGTVLELMDTIAAGIFNSTFLSNTGNPGRGVLLFQRSKVDIEASMFLNNSASGVAYGGVISSYASTVTMTTSEFDQSSAKFGGE